MTFGVGSYFKVCLPAGEEQAVLQIVEDIFPPIETGEGEC
jgi:hypothetical protein